MFPALAWSIAVFWLNALTTTRWAGVDGSINGPKRPFFLCALVAASAALLWERRARRHPRPSEMSLTAARLLAAAGAIVLAAGFFVWFPPHTWRQIPFLDDWPIRYEAAVDMKRLIAGGSFTGWEWRYLGGYHSASDATQGLGTLTFLPMTIFGDALGFHLAHLVLFALVPVLLWRDLALAPGADRRVTAVAVAAVCLTSAGYSYFLVRSGDTNSLGGVDVAMAALLGAHASRLGRRWGPWLLVGSVSLSAYAHPAFFGYAALYLLIDAAVARDRASALRAIVAIGAGAIASLPLTWEIWRYPRLFQFNNLIYPARVPIDWNAAAHAVYYNVEAMAMPWRWFNDFTGLAAVLLPLTIVVAWIDRGRARFYAIAAVGTTALTKLNTIYTGYVFVRPVHMLAVFLAPVVAVVVVRYVRSPALRWSLVAVVALYLQIWWQAVPHVDGVRDFNAALVDRVAAAPGALVALENNPHRNMNADPGGRTERSRFGTHFEVMVASETGRRLYSGGYSDGWQWNPWKGEVIAGGTFMGRGLDATPHDEFVDAMRRWGVSDLFVWSPTATSYLARDARFAPIWRADPWTEYRLSGVDGREVVVDAGDGRLEARDPHGADVVLTGVRRGETVVVRTHYHPAWTASSAGRDVALASHDGQLSFAAPCDGDCRVRLAYPAHRALVPLALAAAVAAAVCLTLVV